MSCFVDQHVHLVKGLQTKNGKLPCAISQQAVVSHQLRNMFKHNDK